MTIGIYVLDDHGEPEECDDFIRWSEWLGTDERRIVRRQTVPVSAGEVEVSTVFLGIDHNFTDTPPYLWETALFFQGNLPELSGRLQGGPQRRYASREDAIAGHNAFVRQLGGTVLEETE